MMCLFRGQMEKTSLFYTWTLWRNQMWIQLLVKSHVLKTIYFLAFISCVKEKTSCLLFCQRPLTEAVPASGCLFSFLPWTLFPLNWWHSWPPELHALLGQMLPLELDGRKWSLECISKKSFQFFMSSSVKTVNMSFDSHFIYFLCATWSKEAATAQRGSFGARGLGTLCLSHLGFYLGF